MCYACGGEGGDQVQLCERCVAERRDRGRLRAKNALAELRGENRKKTVALTEDSRFWAVFGVVVFSIATTCMFLIGPFREMGVIPNLLAGLATGFALLSFVGWAFLLTRMWVFDPIWGVASLIMPGFVYRYLAINWDDAKPMFIAHVVAFALAVLCLTGVSATSNTPMMTVLNTFLHRYQLEVGPSGFSFRGGESAPYEESAATYEVDDSYLSE